jgi:hypothetical protein
MSSTLVATYSPVAYWELDFDLTKVADWFVKWDELHVKFNPTDLSYQVITANFSADDDVQGFKNPTETYITQ